MNGIAWRAYCTQMKDEFHCDVDWAWDRREGHRVRVDEQDWNDNMNYQSPSLHFSSSYRVSMSDVAAYEHQRCVINSKSRSLGLCGNCFSKYYYDCLAFFFLANKALHSGSALLKQQSNYSFLSPINQGTFNPSFHSTVHLLVSASLCSLSPY